MLRLAVLSLLLGLCTGCSFFNRVRLDPVATSFQKPSNVAVYVAVSDGDTPIPDLRPDNFKVYENEQPLAAEDSQQLLLPQELAAYHHTLLLLDTSGENGPDEPLARAAAGFVETVRKKQAVTVFAFDGNPNLRLVAEFPKNADAGPVDLHALAKMGSSDTSRNLNGALLSGLKELDARLNAQQKTVKLGTLVVFTQGADLAGRVTAADANAALSDTEHDVIAIGTAERVGHALTDIGKSGVVRVQGDDGMGVAFEEAAERARDLAEKYYLLAYCSPARGGMRRLKVEVRFRDREGNDKLASFSQDFDATGFGPGCHSESAPHFVPRPKPVATRAQPKSEPSRPPAADAVAPSAHEPAPADDDSVAPPPNKPGYSH